MNKFPNLKRNIPEVFNRVGETLNGFNTWQKWLACFAAGQLMVAASVSAEYLNIKPHINKADLTVCLPGEIPFYSKSIDNLTVIEARTDCVNPSLGWVEQVSTFKASEQDQTNTHPIAKITVTNFNHTLTVPDQNINGKPTTLTLTITETGSVLPADRNTEAPQSSPGNIPPPNYLGTP